MVVHTMGYPADMDGIMSVARGKGVKVLEDCAQSLGASYKGKPLGSIGDVGIYSFQIAKTITSGEGGGLVTNDPLLFERAARYHDLGLLRAPHQAMLGGAGSPGLIGNQYRMSEFTGAVLLAQLRKLDTIVGCPAGPRAARLRGDRRPARALLFATAPTPRATPARTSGWASHRVDQRDRFLKAHGSRERAGEHAARGRPPPYPAGRRAEADIPPELALVHQRTRPGDPLRRRVLPQDDRHPPSLRRRHARPEVHPVATSTISWRRSARSTRLSSRS